MPLADQGTEIGDGLIDRSLLPFGRATLHLVKQLLSAHQQAVHMDVGPSVVNVLLDVRVQNGVGHLAGCPCLDFAARHIDTAQVEVRLVGRGMVDQRFRRHLEHQNLPEGDAVLQRLRRIRCGVGQARCLLGRCAPLGLVRYPESRRVFAQCKGDPRIRRAVRVAEPDRPIELLHQESLAGGMGLRLRSPGVQQPEQSARLSDEACHRRPRIGTRIAQQPGGQCVVSIAQRNLDRCLAVDIAGVRVETVTVLTAVKKRADSVHDPLPVLRFRERDIPPCLHIPIRLGGNQPGQRRMPVRAERIQIDVRRVGKLEEAIELLAGTHPMARKAPLSRCVTIWLTACQIGDGRACPAG
ncbi:hypothetical protein ACKZDW_15140 [Ralstonia syzygii subsp. celebesensis]